MGVFEHRSGAHVCTWSDGAQKSGICSKASQDYEWVCKVARVSTGAFEGTNVLDIGVQVQMLSGIPKFNLVGLPDKAVAESRERVRAALFALGLSLPAKHIAEAPSYRRLNLGK
jgi:hypothetical protein